MERITQGHPLSQSQDIVKENIEQLRKLFPTIVRENQIDPKELEAVLGSELVQDEEYYNFTWAGKSLAKIESNKLSTGTLRPCKEESKDWDTTQNIFIEGDNLEVLKLMQKAYGRKIKIMYFDPPYNTGRNFVYKDDYKDNLSNYLEITKQIDISGKKLRANTENEGRFHSNWLNMMYPRLKLARNLLTDDGVIFISIDDNESSNARKLLDEIFGENNLVAELVVIRAEGGGLAKQVIKGHDYLYVFAKDINIFNPLKRPKDIRGKIITKENEEYWIEEDWLRKEFGKYGTCPYNEIEKYHGLAKKKEIDNGLETGDYVLIDKSGIQIVGRLRKISEDGSKFYSVLKHLNKNGVDDLATLSLERFFDFPKPLSLLKELILGASFFSRNKSDIILDIFAGSATTAHATMQLNAEDAGNRRFIMVQLQEPTRYIDENGNIIENEAFKAGFNTIADIGKERIRRAGEKINSELKENRKTKGTLYNEQNKDDLDIGFRVFKLDSSNINAWDGSVEKLEENLLTSVENIKSERTEEDVLFEILIKYGIDFAQPFEEKVIANCKVFSVGMGVLFVCLSDKITTAVAEGIGSWKNKLQPAVCKVVFKDSGFAGDVDKTNTIQILKRYGIIDVKSV